MSTNTITVPQIASPYQLKWDLRFMKIAKEIGEWSKDRDRKVGCVIVGPHRELRSAGYNGLPRGVNDNDPDRHTIPAKYLWTEHPERNGIYNAANVGIPLHDCTIYITGFPCMDCARAIIQSGIKTVVAYEPDFGNPKWGEDYRLALQMFGEADIYLRYAQP
jgi:dCMP deaminase